MLGALISYFCRNPGLLTSTRAAHVLDIENSYIQTLIKILVGTKNLDQTFMRRSTPCAWTRNYLEACDTIWIRTCISYKLLREECKLNGCNSISSTGPKIGKIWILPVHAAKYGGCTGEILVQKFAELMEIDLQNFAYYLFTKGRYPELLSHA